MTQDRTPANFLVTVDPQYDSVVTAFYVEALAALRFAEQRVILTAEDLKPATDDLALIAHLRKSLEGRRKDYLQPFQNHIKEVNDGYKRLMAPVEQADRITRDKILAFNAEQERKRREQEEINRLRMEASRKEMELNGELAESINLVDVLPPAPTRTQTDMGTSSTFRVRHWEVADLKLVPLEFLMVDAGKITKLVKAGISNISGIHIWEEDSLRITQRK